jgi:pimeloyl-ACP methyl ester carboxylesterase
MAASAKVAATVLALASLVAQDSSLTKAQAEFPAALPAKKVRVNGADLAYVEQGRGEPVILIHGFLMDYRAWSAQMGQLSKCYRVIAYSLRHRWPNAPAAGDAGPPASEFSASVNTADLVALIRALRLKQVHLVGHSAGAAVALRVARDHPQLLRSIVLGEPGPQAFVVSNPEARPLATAEQLNVVRQAFEQGDIESALQIVREIVTGKQASAQPPVPWVRKMLHDNAWHLQLLWMRGVSEPPVTCEEAREIKIPVLLLGGDRSPAVFAQILDALEKCLPTAERAVLPKSSHGLELDNPAAFNETVLKFLARHSLQP